MFVVKNSYGISSVLSPAIGNTEKIGGFGGSSLDRKKYSKKELSFIEELLKKPLEPQETENRVRLRSMSKRTKAKIRRKLIAFARINDKLSFLTLTFCNEVEDQKAVRVLRYFLLNAAKTDKDFQYIWVAEKQSENKVFKNNIHFHLVTNKYWKIKRWWNYWLELQAKHGITPRDENYKPSSAFDVKQVKSNNIKGIVNYLTKHVTKNASQFSCQVWNCSKKISELYTEFYSDISFIRQLERLQASGQLGGEIKTFSKEWCNVHLIPLNRMTLPFYNKIDEKNKANWSKEEVSNGK
jgi:hypothetical protein